MKRRVVVTGIGVVSPIGNDKDEFVRNLKDGVSGVGSIQAYDTSDRKVKLAAEVRLDLSGRIPGGELRKMDRSTAFGVIAAEEAVKDSGISGREFDPARCGVMVASGIGGLSTIEREHSRGLEKGFDRVSPFFIPMAIANMTAGRIAINAGFRGYSAAVVTACAGGSNAVGDAMRSIRHGYADMMICGGAEATVTPLAMGGFTSMRALSENPDPSRASIPFDRMRDGFVMGEGAGILVLEELEHAKKRGANIYAEVVGYGANCDAYHITAPDPSGGSAADVMRLALADAGLLPEDIGYINAHGTSTPLNDRCETLAVKAAFPCSAPPVSSTKSMTGHLLGAAGAVEAIVLAIAVRDGFLPGTVNYSLPDPECDLNIIAGKGESRPLRYAMSNSLGFGGHNTSLIFARYDGQEE